MERLTAVLLNEAVLIPNLIGTFVFAISGGVAGVKERVDIFGLSVLAFAAGNAGGITPDLLLGGFPAGSISDWRFLAVSVLAAGEGEHERPDQVGDEHGLTEQDPRHGLNAWLHAHPG